MTEWKSADIVTTTYGTIKKAQQESFDEGVAFEQARILKLLEFELYKDFEASHGSGPAWQTMELLVTAIKGENK